VEENVTAMEPCNEVDDNPARGMAWWEEGVNII